MKNNKKYMHCFQLKHFKLLIFLEAFSWITTALKYFVENIYFNDFCHLIFIYCSLLFISAHKAKTQSLQTTLSASFRSRKAL